MADQGFALPASSYKELVKIIQGYGRVPENSVPADIGKVTGINETIVSSNNAFLKAVGIIQGGKKKTTTSVGKSLAAAYDYERVSEIGSIWRSVVEVNDFLQKVVAAVRIRKGMDESSLEAHVAYSAGQPKSPRVLTGAGTIVEILKTAALLREEAGNLLATSPEPPSIPETVEKSLSISDRFVEEDSARAYVRANTRGPALSRLDPVGTVQLNIEVSIQCTPKDLDDLGYKLRKVIKDLNESVGPNRETEQGAPAAPAPAGNGEAQG